MRNNTSWVALGIVFLALFVAVMERGNGSLIDLYHDSTHVAQRSGVNLIEGDDLTLSSEDDPANGRVDFTITVASHAGTDIASDLEEDLHASEHASGGDDLIYSERDFVFFGTGDVSTSKDVEQSRLYASAAGTVQDARCSTGSAPTSDEVVVDVNLDGTTIFTTQSNRPAISAGNFTDVSGTPTVQSFTGGQYFTIEIDSADTGNSASDLTCQIRVREAIY